MILDKDIYECTHPIYNIYLFEIYFKKREIIRRNSCRKLADHLQFVLSPSDKKKTGYSMETFPDDTLLSLHCATIHTNTTVVQSS